jgi:hypothetical protein
VGILIFSVGFFWQLKNVRVQHSETPESPRWKKSSRPLATESGDFKFAGVRSSAIKQE